MTKIALGRTAAVRLSLGLLIVVAFLVPVFVANAYITTLLILACFSVINVCAYNLLMGYTGLLSLGQSGFYAIGAYASALAAKKLGLPWPIALMVAGFVAALCSAAVGAVVLRLRGAYFAMVTFAFSQLIILVIQNWESLTGGVYGLLGVPRLFKSGVWSYVLALALVVLVYYVLHRIANSQFGRILRAVRQDENVALAAGVNVFRYKMTVFIISSAITGIVGGLMAHYLRYAYPSFGDFTVSANMLTATVVGGPGYLVGPGVAAVFFSFLPEWSRPVGQYYLLVYGIILVTVIVFIPGGLEAGFKSLYRRVRYRQLPARQGA